MLLLETSALLFVLLTNERIIGEQCAALLDHVTEVSRVLLGRVHLEQPFLNFCVLLILHRPLGCLFAFLARYFCRLAHQSRIAVVRIHRKAEGKPQSNARHTVDAKVQLAYFELISVTCED